MSPIITPIPLFQGTKKEVESQMKAHEKVLHSRLNQARHDFYWALTVGSLAIIVSVLIILSVN